MYLFGKFSDRRELPVDSKNDTRQKSPKYLDKFPVLVMNQLFPRLLRNLNVNISEQERTMD